MPHPRRVGYSGMIAPALCGRMAHTHGVREKLYLTVVSSLFMILLAVLVQRTILSLAVDSIRVMEYTTSPSKRPPPSL